MSRFLFWGYKSSEELLDSGLGTLERTVMDIVWARGDTTVKDACERLGQDVAYTTVMTTMDRLFKKGLLTRERAGRAFVYRAAASRDALEGAVTASFVERLLDGGGREPLTVLSSLVDAVSARDRELLDELERLIQLKRRQLQRR